jgi:hypothetical protein
MQVVRAQVSKSRVQVHHREMPKRIWKLSFTHAIKDITLLTNT